LRSYSRPTKTGEIRHVPILDPLLPVLQEWRLQNPLQHVFPNERGGMQGPSARILQEIFHRVLERAGMPRAITFHDLRHTFASHWMMRGGDIFRLQRILGHKSTQMTQRYSHLSPDVFKEDYGRLANLVPREPRNNVTPFHQRQVEHHSAQDRP
ncbi:MAG: site-specific integrase, partial [Deltaproteobacteria bacterium]|nr:site-specific integrase [Deltaproteobacteria bacterium]